jgi:putative membrane protein
MVEQYPAKWRTAMGEPIQKENPFDVPAFELASCQASLAFERTLASLDQSLMAAIRTSLSLIGFGFAMFLFFNQAGGDIGVSLRVPARNFGLSLVAMGIGTITIGLVGHRRRFRDLRAKMDDLHRRNLLLEGCPYRRAPIATLALLLLLSGLLVMLGILVRIGPFG